MGLGRRNLPKKETGSGHIWGVWLLKGYVGDQPRVTGAVCGDSVETLHRF